ncbi:TPA: hypothetical protein ACH3X1_001587 [Trebouxia sp. C0004]
MRVWRDVADSQDKRPLLGLRWPKSQPNGAIGPVCLPVTDGEKQLLSYCQKDTLTSSAKRSGGDGED